MSERRKRRKFVATIYCGNCRTVGDYEFAPGTILRESSEYVHTEYRYLLPSEDDTEQHNLSANGRAVKCKFCGRSEMLITRQRNGDVPLAHGAPPASAEEPAGDTDGGGSPQ
jgi:hypothetical protein